MRISLLALPLLLVASCGPSEEEVFTRDVIGVYRFDVDHALGLRIDQRREEDPALVDLITNGVSLADAEFASEEDKRKAWIEQAKKIFPNMGGELILEPGFGFTFEGTNVEIFPPEGRWELAGTTRIRIFLGDGSNPDFFVDLEYSDGDLTVLDEKRGFIFRGV
jgi:hypothetical protein